MISQMSIITLICLFQFIFHIVNLSFPPVLIIFVFQYNSVSMKNKTAEEVYVEMLKPAETVTLKVQHRPDDFTMIKDVPGDGFYIRYKHTHQILRHGCVMVLQMNSSNFPRTASSRCMLLYITHSLEPPFGQAGNFLIQPITSQIQCAAAVIANHTTNIGYLIFSRHAAGLNNVLILASQYFH